MRKKKLGVGGAERKKRKKKRGERGEKGERGERKKKEGKKERGGNEEMRESEINDKRKKICYNSEKK